MPRFIRFVAVLLMVAAGLAGASTVATAAPPPITVAADGWYQIVNDRTGKCVTVPNSSHASGQRLQQWPCDGGDSQRWAPFRTDDDFFMLISKNTPSLCMNLQIASIFVDQQTCDTASVLQRWQWRAANDQGNLVLGIKLPGFAGGRVAAGFVNTPTDRPYPDNLPLVARKSRTTDAGSGVRRT